MTKTIHVDNVTLAFDALGKQTRQCGECTLCCKFLPVVDNEPWRPGIALNKPAMTRCPHQKHRKGCGVYGTAEMPFACKAWNCRWLVNNDTADQARPDRSGYVIDIMPDYIIAMDDDQRVEVEVIQIWTTDRTVHRTDKNLRAYIERRGKEGKLCLMRYNSHDALTVIPPSMTSDGQWHEKVGISGAQHTPGQIWGLEER